MQPKSDSGTRRSAESTKPGAQAASSVGVFFARPLVGSRWTARPGPLAPKTPTLLNPLRRATGPSAGSSQRGVERSANHSQRLTSGSAADRRGARGRAGGTAQRVSREARVPPGSSRSDADEGRRERCLSAQWGPATLRGRRRDPRARETALAPRRDPDKKSPGTPGEQGVPGQ